MGLLRLLGRCLRAVAMAALVGGALAFAAVPGPYRAFTPELYGLTEAAPNLYLDDPAAAPRIRDLLAAADANVADFFGPLQTDPVWVICTTSACENRMGMRANGLTFGYHLILMGPNGVNETVLTHERTHAELHRHLGPSDLFGPKFPAWFDEGLAAWLSGDTRLHRPADARQADWIRAAGNYLEWTRMREGRDWRDSYGAAARLVDEIVQNAGRDGLRTLIARVGEKGEDFDTVYRRLAGR